MINENTCVRVREREKERKEEARECVCMCVFRRVCERENLTLKEMSCSRCYTPIEIELHFLVKSRTDPARIAIQLMTEINYPLITRLTLHLI